MKFYIGDIRAAFFFCLFFSFSPVDPCCICESNSLSCVTRSPTMLYTVRCVYIHHFLGGICLVCNQKLRDVMEEAKVKIFLSFGCTTVNMYIYSVGNRADIYADGETCIPDECNPNHCCSYALTKMDIHQLDRRRRRIKKGYKVEKELQREIK